MSNAHDRPSVVGVVIVAAGMGTRLGAGMPKALVQVAGRPLVLHAMSRIRSAREVAEIVVVVPPHHRDEFAALLDSVANPAEGSAAGLSPNPPVTLVDGGAERTDSVAAGLAALSAQCEIVLVHDAARAFAPPELFDAVAEAVRAGADAVVPGLPVVDTMKQVDAAGVVQRTVPRVSLRAIQTPQGFRRHALDEAHVSGQQATDDAALVEQAGGRVVVIDGSPEAFKITTPADLDRAHRQHGAARPVLVVLTGRSGVGKTTIARELALRAGLVHVRVDTIEEALRASGALDEAGVAGYRVGYAIAAEQLGNGLSVVADSVNPIALTRHAWQQVGREHDARVIEVEVCCSDPNTHRHRLETRATDGVEQPAVSWAECLQREYQSPEPHLRLDTAQLSVEESVARIVEVIRGQ